MTNKRLSKSIKKFSRKKEDRVITISGMLGLPLNGAKTVSVPNRDGFVFVRLKDNTSEVIQAYNSEVSPIYDLPVLVTRQGNVYKVIGRNLTLYRDWGSVPYLPKHGGQHSFNVALGIGGDITWVFSQQFMPLLGYPSGTSMMLTVEPHVYEWEGQWKYAQNTGTPSFAPFVPTSGAMARMALLYIDGRDNSLNIAAGESFSNLITDPATLFTFLPDVPRSIGIPIAGVKLPTGTTSLEWTNVYDVRDFYTVGMSSGSAASNSIFIWDEGVLQGTATTLNVVGALADISVSGSVARLFITGSGGGSNPNVQDEGSPLGAVDTFNFVGDGVVASVSGTVVRVFVTGTSIESIQDIAGQMIQGGQQSNIQVTYEDDDEPPTISFTVTAIPQDGWLSGLALSYLSSDAPSYVVVSSGISTGTVGVGMRQKLDHLGQTKYFIVTSVSVTGTNTYFNLYGGTDYTLTTGSITNSFYSPVKAPVGFPTDPAKWTVTLTDTSEHTKTSPTANTFYGGANAWTTGSNMTIDMPIGKWYVDFTCFPYVVSNAAQTACTVYANISTTNNGTSDTELQLGAVGGGAAGVLQAGSPGAYKQKLISVNSKTTWYILLRTTTASMDTIYLLNNGIALSVRFVCAYL